jgi:hypothetical protein
VKKVDQAIRGRGNRRLKDLDMMTVFAHTGPNETLNALRNKVNILNKLALDVANTANTTVVPNSGVYW